MPRRLGILGGTFDPPHAAHVDIARAVLAADLVDEVVVIPAGDPWQKSDVSSAADRLAMTRLAFAGVPHCSVSDIEVRRAGATYAVDTIAELAAPDVQLRYIVGSDTFAGLDTWQQISDVVRSCDFLVVPRPGVPVVVPPVADVRHEVVSMRPVELASTNIRALLAAGGPRPRTIPTAVWQYIVEHQLYGVQHSTLRRPLLVVALGVLAAVGALVAAVTLASQGFFVTRDVPPPPSSGWVVLGVRAPDALGGVITTMAVGGAQLDLESRQLDVAQRPLQLNDPSALRQVVGDELQRPMAGAVILDRLAFAGLVDAAGGITLGADSLDGLAAADAVLADPSGLRLREAVVDVLQELPADEEKLNGLVRSLGSALKATVGASTVVQWMEFWQSRL